MKRFAYSNPVEYTGGNIITGRDTRVGKLEDEEKYSSPLDLDLFFIRKNNVLPKKRENFETWVNWINDA